MGPPLLSPFNPALYPIPRYRIAVDSVMNHLRAKFKAIPGCPEDLLDQIYQLRNENPVLKTYGDVYFSPLHRHWVIATFSRPGGIHDPMPTRLGPWPIYCQGTPAIVIEDPKNPRELLKFAIIPQSDLTGDQIAAIRRFFPRLAGLYVHPWGHVSLLFHNMRAIFATFESRFLPVRLGGLTYSLELLDSRAHRTSAEVIPSETGCYILASIANTWNGLKRSMSCCGSRKPSLGNQN